MILLNIDLKIILNKVDDILQELNQIKKINDDEEIDTLINILVYLKINENNVIKYTDDIYFINVEDDIYLEVKKMDINYIIYSNNRINKRVKLYKYHINTLNKNDNYKKISKIYTTILQEISDLNYMNNSVRENCLKISINSNDKVSIRFIDGSYIENYHFIDEEDFEIFMEDNSNNIKNITINSILYERKDIFSDEYQQREYADSLIKEDYEFLNYLKINKLNKYLKND